jgi:hypothetical protein
MLGCLPGERAEGTQALMRCKNKIGWAATLLRKAAQPMVLKPGLSGLATGARREVDDLAPQFFRSPPLLWVEVCRNIEPDQFRHDVLLAGDPTPPCNVSAEPMPESGPVKVHISLFLTLVFTSSKLTATHKNTNTKEELLAGMREKTQVW